MEKIKTCQLCGEILDYQSGQFDKHIKTKHDLNREVYIIITQYNNIKPKCQCGFCEDDAKLIPRKNIFFIINPEHRKFKWLEEKYIEKNGKPICVCGCGNNVSFYRGKPREYYSYKCLPNRWNQEKIKETVIEKYGVENPFQAEKIKSKIKETNLERYGSEFASQNKLIKNKVKKTKKEKYGDENYCNSAKIRKTCLIKYGVDSYSKTKEYRDMSSKTVIKTNKDNAFPSSKRYKNTSLYYQSMYEYKFLEYCENLDILHLIKRSKSFNYLKEDNTIGNRHIPDFLFNKKQIIEIKSTYWLEKQGGWTVINAKKRSVETKGYNYILLLDNDFTEFNKLIGK